MEAKKYLITVKLPSNLKLANLEELVSSSSCLDTKKLRGVGH